MLHWQDCSHAHQEDHLHVLVLLCCCQVTRDRILSHWQWAESHLAFADDRAYGSGYPGDARCVGWLARNLEPTFGYPDVLRFR
jgi:hypothetical protein